jgi:hypothetical protein
MIFETFCRIHQCISIKYVRRFHWQVVRLCSKFNNLTCITLIPPPPSNIHNLILMRDLECWQKNWTWLLKMLNAG